MSFLKRLLGSRAPHERIQEAEELLASGDPGSARLELEAALGAEGLGPGDGERARSLLSRACEALATLRLTESRAFLEADDCEQAQAQAELAASLAREPATRAHAERLKAEVKEATAEKTRRREREEEEEAAAAVEHEAEVEPEIPPEGDEALSPLEVAFLGLPEEEADRLRALAAADPVLGEALVEAYEGRAGAARDRFRRLSEPAASEALVRREWARAELEAGDAAKACELLERARRQAPEDPALLELVLEAHLAAGDKEKSALAARDLLSQGVVRDFDRAIRALAEASKDEEALGYVDRVIQRDPKVPALWQLRGFVCERLGDAEAAREADERAVEEFEEAMAADPLSQRRRAAPAFPLESGRRLGAAIEAEIDQPGDPEGAAATLRLLASQDDGRRSHWEALLGRLERE